MSETKGNCGIFIVGYYMERIANSYYINTAIYTISIIVLVITCDLHNIIILLYLSILINNIHIVIILLILV